MARMSKTWWGQRFIRALEAFTDPARLGRGRGYATTSRIKSWDIAGHIVTAKIRGNINPYYGVYKEPTYTTRIEFTPIQSKDWNKLIQALSAQASFIARLLMNEMPDTIEMVFAEQKRYLLPQSRKDLKTDCSCPDYANPCKHIAGLYYFLAARLDQDPFLLFELRGLSRDDLQRQLRQSPLGKALAQALDEQAVAPQLAESYFTRPRRVAMPAKIAVKDFWRGKKRLPASLEPITPAIAPAILIKKGGDFPAFWPKDTSFIEAMEEFYERVRRE